MRNGILYHKNDTHETECPDRNTMQLILPTKFRMQALRGYHDDLGCLGIERMLDLLRDQFYWPSMTEDTTRFIVNVKVACNLRHLLTEHPWKMLMQHILWNWYIWTT